MHEKCGTADAGNMMAIKAKGGERLRGKMEKVLQLQDDFTLQSLWSINKKKLFKYSHVHGKGIGYKYMYKYILEFKTRHEYY